MKPDHKTALDKAREGAQRLKTFADKARSLGLPVLESFLREASVACQAGADFQERALGGLEHQTAATVIDRDPGPARISMNDFDKLTNEEAAHQIEYHEAQADKIAAAMKRRGLIS